LWIYVNSDAGYNFREFSHILAGSKMQPLMAAKSWLDPDTVGVVYVSVTGVK
jgi:hypothetical protein